MDFAASRGNRLLEEISCLYWCWIHATIDKLRTVVGSTEVKDDNGVLLGHFYSVVTPESIDQYECPLSEEELLRRSQEGGGRPLADILRDLEKHK